MVSQYQIIEVSWEKRFLQGRSFPQSVKITTPGFLARLKEEFESEFNTKGVSFGYYDRLPDIVNDFSDPLTGEMDYKCPLDYMDAYYYRRGMIACVSEKVKTILERNMVTDKDFYLKPIKIKNVEDLFYVLFVPLISFDDARVDFGRSVFQIADVDDPHYHERIRLSSVKEYKDYKYLESKQIYLMKPAIERSVWFHEACSYCFFSQEIANSFVQEKVTGATVVPLGERCSLFVESMK